MAGSGSAPRPREARKTTVEECLALNVGQGDVLPPGGVLLGSTGSVSWDHPDTGQQRASVWYRLTPVLEKATLRMDLGYSVGGEKVTLPIWLATTPVYFGGSRWWWLCPLSGCGRRVGRLYLPPRRRFFGCRHCHDLTYRSSQQAHKRDAPHAKAGGDDAQ
jgi:hypothetical protein